MKFLSYYLNGFLDESHCGVASLYVTEKAFWGEIFKNLNQNILAKFSALFLGIRISTSALLLFPPKGLAGSQVKRPCPVLISPGKEVVSL